MISASCDGQVSEYLGDLRMRSVNVAMGRVGSRQNLSSTAAAFMDLAEEEEGADSARGSQQVRIGPTPRTANAYERI